MKKTLIVIINKYATVTTLDNANSVIYMEVIERIVILSLQFWMLVLQTSHIRFYSERNMSTTGSDLYIKSMRQIYVWPNFVSGVRPDTKLALCL